MASDELYDTIVIGAGIAGLSSAIYTCRLGLKTAIISIDIGGQLTYAGSIENYPGFEALSGLELVFKVRNQAKSFGAEIIIDEVVELSKEGNIFIVRTKGGRIFKSLSVIAACGKAPKKLGIEGEDKFVGRGLSYCVICDGPFYKGKRVVLISYGIKGIEGLELLAPIASEVHYVTSMKHDESLEVAKKFNNVKTYPGYHLTNLSKTDGIFKLTLVGNDNYIKELEADGVFIELGFETRIDFLKKYVDVNNKGEIVVGNYCETKVEGLFAAGDLIDTPYKQAVIAAATGVVAALSAVNYVNKIKGRGESFRADWGKKTSVTKKKAFRLQ
ncbi:MAG: FAD-dependent oxidoreductase [Sulfolobales archaeon]